MTKIPQKIPKIFMPTTKQFLHAALNCRFNTKWRNLTVIMRTKLFLATLPLGASMAFPGIKNILLTLPQHFVQKQLPPI
jgi:hypothetical protein